METSWSWVLYLLSRLWEHIAVLIIKTITMEKEIREFEIDYDLNWRGGVEIDQVQQDLDELKKLGATHIEIEPYQSFDLVFVDIKAIVERIETDEEFKQRLDEEKKHQEDIKRKELEMLKGLQEKYGTK